MAKAKPKKKRTPRVERKPWERPRFTERMVLK